jgi:hypothetical protein
VVLWLQGGAEGDDPMSGAVGQPSGFHSQDLDFGLDYVDYLSPAQLGLACIAHKDYEGWMARDIKKAWNKLRAAAQQEGKVGRVIVTPGERGDWPGFAAIDLDWAIPINLEILKSEQLAVSLLAPSRLIPSRPSQAT